MKYIKENVLTGKLIRAGRAISLAALLSGCSPEPPSIKGEDYAFPREHITNGQHSKVTLEYREQYINEIEEERKNAKSAPIDVLIGMSIVTLLSLVSLGYVFYKQFKEGGKLTSCYGVETPQSSLNKRCVYDWERNQHLGKHSLLYTLIYSRHHQPK